MPIKDEDRRQIIKYRFEKAMEEMTEARDNAALGHWSLAVNRLYYSALHTVSAVLLSHGISPKSHSGAIMLFGKEFISTGRLDESVGRLLAKLSSMRNTGDYDDCFDWSADDVEPLFEPTEQFVKLLKSIYCPQE